MDEQEIRKIDYEQTMDQFQMLTDIRFKLLALVPTLTGLAIYLTPSGDPEQQAQMLAIGILGLSVISGVIIYEVRNSELYDALWYRASCLEALLGFDSFHEDFQRGGPFLSRPGTGLQIGQMSLGHTEGLALVYGATSGAWAWITATGVLSLARIPGGWWLWVLSAAVAFCVIALLIWIRRRSQARIGTPGYLKDLPQPIWNIVHGDKSDGSE
jgi:hypothetical protein